MIWINWWLITLRDEKIFHWMRVIFLLGHCQKKQRGNCHSNSAMDYDAMTLGNHEFEYGWEILVDTT